jgi:hypothetical protein
MGIGDDDEPKASRQVRLDRFRWFEVNLWVFARRKEKVDMR